MATDLSPRRWKRGQKRTARDAADLRRFAGYYSDAIARGATWTEAVRYAHERMEGSAELGWISDEDFAKQGGTTLHAEDVPRVGERARERAARAKFGGDW